MRGVVLAFSCTWRQIRNKTILRGGPSPAFSTETLHRSRPRFSPVKSPDLSRARSRVTRDERIRRAYVRLSDEKERTTRRHGYRVLCPVGIVRVRAIAGVRKSRKRGRTQHPRATGIFAAASLVARREGETTTQRSDSNKGKARDRQAIMRSRPFRLQRLYDVRICS